MTQATWQFSAFNPHTGEIIDFLDAPADGIYTRRLDDYSDFQATITEPNDFFSVQPYESGIMCMRDGIPRFRGRVVDPFERSPRQRKVMAKDPFHNLYWRRVREHLKCNDQPDEIAWNLIHLQNTYEDIGLRDGGDRAWGDAAVRKYQAGDVVSDEIKALALTHGEHFHFKMNCRYDTEDPKAMAAFNTFNVGPVRDDVRFEFGSGTLENVADYQIEYGQVINRATVIGQRSSSRDAIGKTVNPGNCVAQTATSSGKDTSTPDVFFDATDSERRYGMWEDEFNATTKAGQAAHLLGLAKAKLTTGIDYGLGSSGEEIPTAVPPRTVTITPNNDGPAIFSDFDVGDRVRVRIHDYDFTLVTEGTVWEIVVNIDPDSGQETISTVSFIDLQDTSA